MLILCWVRTNGIPVINLRRSYQLGWRTCLWTKTTFPICKYSLQYIIYKIGLCWANDCTQRWIGSIQILFAWIGIILPVITTHNPKGNGKVEWQDSLTIKALIKVCDEKPSDWPHFLLHYGLIKLLEFCYRNQVSLIDL